MKRSPREQGICRLQGWVRGGTKLKLHDEALWNDGFGSKASGKLDRALTTWQEAISSQWKHLLLEGEERR